MPGEKFKAVPLIRAQDLGFWFSVVVRGTVGSVSEACLKLQVALRLSQRSQYPLIQEYTLSCRGFNIMILGGFIM